MKLAVIGASGHFANAFAAFGQHGGHELIAVAPGSPGEDITPLLNGCGERRLSPNYYSDYATLLENESIDLAVVNPWYCDNAVVSAACLSRGVHVYSEKPLAIEFGALNDLERCYRESGRALAGMFDIRGMSWFQAIDEAMKENAIGEVRMMSARKSYKLGRRGPLYHVRASYGGMLPWVAIHAIDWLLHFGGAPCRVSALQNADCNRDHGGLEMTAAALLETKGGVLSTVTADSLRPTGSARHDDDRLLITGTRGTLEAVDGQVYLTDDGPRRALPLPPARVPLLDFIASIGTPGEVTYAEDALLATRVALRMRQAGDEGRWVEVL